MNLSEVLVESESSSELVSLDVSEVLLLLELLCSASWGSSSWLNAVEVVRNPQRHIVNFLDMHVSNYDGYIILLDGILIAAVGLVSGVPLPYNGRRIVLCGQDVALKPSFAEKCSCARRTRVPPASVVLPFGHLKRHGSQVRAVSPVASGWPSGAALPCFYTCRGRTGG